ncbi:MAG: lysine--tRNA ligase [Euryarchaeota archaeon]|nr:lysine--tRNA ligase [Euryarchaeota archaeon]
MTHWADVLAREVAPKADRHLLATAITPSGPIHVGNMREVLTTEMVYRSLRDVEKVPAELVYIADSYDPLRKVYPFMDPAKYQDFVGRPLREIPCLCGSHKDYAQHFLEPFLASIKELGVEFRVLDAYDMYREGKYAEAVEDALGATEKMKEIIEAESKRNLPPDWIPFNMQCEKCRKLPNTRPTLVDGNIVEYSCTCGHHGRMDVRKGGMGKLPWRVDWPARWRFLGVTFEAMGKDHAAAGSSWDTGIRISKEVFGYDPPTRTVYEFVMVKGVGAMHSSTGTAIGADEMLKMTPPEVLRFLIAKNQPNKHIEFDPGLGILQLVEEFDEWERVNFGAAEARVGMNDAERTYQLSCPHGPPAELPLQVHYRHLVTVAQIAPSLEQAVRVLRRTGDLVVDPEGEDKKRLQERVEHVRYWLRRFAPDDVKVELQPSLPRIDFAQPEKKLLHEVRSKVAALEWRAELIHNALHETAKEHGLKPGEAFAAVYKAFLGKPRGPRAGHFLSSLDKAFVLQRLDEAAA